MEILKEAISSNRLEMIFALIMAVLGLLFILYMPKLVEDNYTERKALKSPLMKMFRGAAGTIFAFFILWGIYGAVFPEYTRTLEVVVTDSSQFDFDRYHIDSHHGRNLKVTDTEYNK